MEQSQAVLGLVIMGGMPIWSKFLDFSTISSPQACLSVDARTHTPATLVHRSHSLGISLGFLHTFLLNKAHVYSQVPPVTLVYM